MSSRGKAVAFVGAAILCCAGLAACSLVLASDLNAGRELVSSPVQPDADSAPPVASDGGADADADAALPRTGCSGLDPSPQFCEDFDDGPLAGSWDQLVKPNGTIAFDPLAYSPPRSGRVNLVEAPFCSNARFERAFSGIGTKRVEVRVRMRPTSPWTGDFTPLTLGLTGCALLLYAPTDGSGGVKTASVNIQSGNPVTNDVRVLVGGPRVDEWTDVRITAVRQGAGAAITFAFEHPDGAISEKTESVSGCRLGGDLSIGVGYHCNFGNSETRYDDVRAYWE